MSLLIVVINVIIAESSRFQEIRVVFFPSDDAVLRTHVNYAEQPVVIVHRG